MTFKKLAFASLTVAATLFSGAAHATLIDQFLFNGNATDTGSLPLTMTAHGNVNYTSDAPAGLAHSANFAGGSYLRADGSPYNNVSGDFSVGFWLKTGMNSATGSQWYNGDGLVDAETPGVTSDWGFSLLNNKVAFGIGGGDVTIQSASTVNDGTWHFVVGTWDIDTGAMSLYIDGVLSATGAAATGQPRTGENHLTFGELSTNLYNYTGKLADVQIYNEVLSASQVSALDHPGQVPEPASLALLGLGLAALGARRRKTGSR